MFALRNPFNRSSAKPEGRPSAKGKSGLGIILTAALLIVLISGVQYYYSHKMLESQLERNAELELRMKAILVKGTINAMEYVLRDHSNDLQRSRVEADSMFKAVERLLAANPHVVGAGVAFAPGYYPERDSLFEPWAYYADSAVASKQLAGAQHDYTKMDFYTGAIANGNVYWSEPYTDENGLGVITTASIPVYDGAGDFMAVLGIDVSLNWLGDTINSRHLYDSSFDMLITQGGSLIAGPASEVVEKETVESVVAMINDSAVGRRLSETGVSTIIRYESPERGDARVFFAFMRGKPHWQIAVVCYDDEVFDKLTSMRDNILLLALLGMLLLGYIIYRSIRDQNSLQRVSVETARYTSELQVAQNIQKEMLPKHYPPFADRHDVDIYGVLEPAREVGGDLFDFFMRDEKLFFCIGDVSGKGVPSALLMAVTHALFRSAAVHESNPARIMKSLNELSCENNESCMFVTFFVGVLDLPTGRLRYCNGGHDLPFVIDSTGIRYLPAAANMPIGLFADFVYEAQEALLAPGAMLFLYTDGLTEARNPQRELFGDARVSEALERLSVPGMTSRQLLEGMNGAVASFIADAEPSDDLTMLAIRYTPQAERSLLHESVTLTNDVSDVERLGAFMKALTLRLGMERSTASNLRLAIEEAVVNVMSYAYPKETTGSVTVAADVFAPNEASGCECQQLCIKITDRGVAFDPTDVAEADTTLAAEDRPIGGLGILLMRELMDSINYERNAGQNVLTLKKKLNNNPIKNKLNEDNNP